jgi:hypothetical protein
MWTRLALGADTMDESTCSKSSRENIALSRRESRELDPMEIAFIKHVMRNDPHCADRLMALLTSIYPQFRN